MQNFVHAIYQRLRCQVFIGACAVDGNELSRGKAAGDDFITRATASSSCSRSCGSCSVTASFTRIHAPYAEKGTRVRSRRIARNREGQRGRSETIAGERAVEGMAQGGNRRTRQYVDLHNDSPRLLEIYTRDPLSSITSEAAAKRINLARGNYIRGKMRLLLIPINSHVVLLLRGQD